MLSKCYESTAVRFVELYLYMYIYCMKAFWLYYYIRNVIEYEIKFKIYYNSNFWLYFFANIVGLRI